MNDYGSFAQEFGNDVESLYFILVIYGAIGLFVFASFIIKGFGMYGIAKRLGVPEAWLAFIPIANNYLQGELAGRFTIGKKDIKSPGMWTLIYPFIYGAILFGLLVIFFIILAVSASFDSSLTSDTPSTQLIFSIIFSYILFLLVALGGQAIYYAIYGLVRFKIHERYMDDGKATVHMILGLFIPMYQSITYLRLSKKLPLGFDTPSAPPSAPFGSPGSPITHQPLPTINGEPQ